MLRDPPKPTPPVCSMTHRRAFCYAPNCCMLGAMDHTITAVERAFQLAKSGRCTSVDDLRRRLRAEGYAANQITGPALSKQLATFIKGARGQSHA